MKAESKRFLWGDAVVYIVLIALCAGLFLAPVLFARSGDGLLAALSVDGETVETIDLAALEEQTVTRNVNGCEIEFGSGGVRFTAADCPDRICVKTGLISKGGEAIACVPNRVAVTLRRQAAGRDPFDVVTY